MFFKKVSLIFVVAVILLFSLASIAMAAPPLQTPDDGTDDSSVGDTIDFDNIKPNLGTIMSDKDGNDDTDGMEGEEPEGEDSEGEEPEGDDPDGEEPEGEEPEDEEMTKEHPVGSAMAKFFGEAYGVPDDEMYDSIMGFHQAGNGFGNIVKAYFIGGKLGMTPDEIGQILEEAHGTGWGNVMKEYGLHPGNGKGPQKEKDTPPGQAKKNGDEDVSDELAGQGGGQDKEKGTPPGQAKKNGDDITSELVGQGGQDKDKDNNSNGNNGNGNGGNSNKGGNGKGKGKNK
jgi:hypothetical protein